MKNGIVMGHLQPHRMLPPVDCVEGCESIRKNTDDVDANEFLDYFEKTDMGLPRIFGSGRRSPGSKLKNRASTIQWEQTKTKPTIRLKSGTEFSIMQ